MDYSEALQYLNSFINYEKDTSYNYNSSFKLERMARFAALLGDPQNGIRSIHVAGSKGKGSTAAFIQSILGSAGYRTGLYTSPHLLSFRERIRIGDRLIEEDEMSGLLERMKGPIETLRGPQKPSFFEVYTAMAYLYFKDKKVDFAVYETGLGGRLDATNIIEPLVTVITPVSYEHMDKLGDTLAQIASEKAGIVKHGVPSVSAPQDEEALSVIDKICKDRGSDLTVVGRDVTFELLSSNETGTEFIYNGKSGGPLRLRTPLLGPHQAANAATAIAAVEVLSNSREWSRPFRTMRPFRSSEERSRPFPTEMIRNGIASAKWPGRLQVIARKPTVVLDGAQNRASARALSESIRSIFRYNKLTLVLGVSKDKDIEGIMDELLPLADSVILTKSSVKERAAEPAKMKELARAKDVIMTSSVNEAMGIARQRARPDDLILVTGSLFVVGDVLKNA